MCYFITATVPESTSIDELNAVLDDHGLRFGETENPYVQRQLPKSHRYGSLSIGHGHCDCGTPLGAGEDGIDPLHVSERQMRKLRRKKWSPQRIEKWKRQKQIALERKQATADRYRMATLESWQDALEHIINSGAATSIGLLKHWYSGDQRVERFNVTVQRLSVDNATPEFLSRISEDVLYVFGQEG